MDLGLVGRGAVAAIDLRGRCLIAGLLRTAVRDRVNLFCRCYARPRGAARSDRPDRAAWAALRLLADVADFFFAESGSGRTMKRSAKGIEVYRGKVILYAPSNVLRGHNTPIAQSAALGDGEVGGAGRAQRGR